jgi:hypothetical protein
MPITPRLMELLAEFPEVWAANAGRTAGRIAADPAAFRKLRRLNERGGRASSEPDFWDIIHLTIFRTGVATARLGSAAAFGSVPGIKTAGNVALQVLFLTIFIEPALLAGDARHSLFASRFVHIMSVSPLELRGGVIAWISVTG